MGWHDPRIVATRMFTHFFRQRWWLICNDCSDQDIGPFDSYHAPMRMLKEMRLLHTDTPFPSHIIHRTGPWA